MHSPARTRAHTHALLIRLWVTLVFEFWVSDKAVLVPNCLSPTQTFAKQGTKLTLKTCCMVTHYTYSKHLLLS